MKELARPLVIKPSLELGSRYKLEIRLGDKREPKGEQNAKLIYLDEKIAVFDNGKYRDCQMIKNYKHDWEVKRV